MIKVPPLVTILSLQLGIAISYSLVAHVVLKFATVSGNVTLIWPSSGIALACLILFGKKYAIGVFVGAFLAGFFVGNPHYVSLLIALGNTLEPLIALYLLRFFSFSANLFHIHDYRSLIITGFLVGIVSALHGGLALLTASFIPISSFHNVFIHWWMSDFIGILLFTPFLLLISQYPIRSILRQRIFEVLCLLFCSFLIAFLILTDWKLTEFYTYRDSYLLAIPLFWSIMRFDQTLTSLIIIVFFAVGIYGLSHQQGIFLNGGLQENLKLFWVYFTVISIISMTAAFVNSERGALFHAINNSKSELYIFSTKNMRLEFVNNVALDNLNVSFTKAITLSTSDLFPFKSQQEIQELLIPLLKNKNNVVTFETIHQYKNNSYFPVEVIIQRVNQPHKEYFMATITNISDRKEKEAHRILGNQVCDISTQAIMVTDKNNKIIRINHAFTEITGYQSAEIIGQDPDILSSGRHETSFYLDLWNSLNKTRSWEGEIYNRRKNGELYLQHLTIKTLQNSAGEIENYIAMFTDITLEHEQFKQLKHRSEHDILTGLPSRTLLHEKFKFALASAKRHHNCLALLYIDLNNFKIINDNYGHTTGDKILQIISNRILACIRDNDLASRIGGDEFIVLLTDITSLDDGKTMSNKLKEVTSQTITLKNIEHQVSSSIGIAIYPENGICLDDLLNFADNLMYQDKQRMKQS